MPRKSTGMNGEDEVARCRRMREEFDKRFKTLDEMFDYCERLRTRRGLRTAKARPNTKPRRMVRNAKPAPRKAVHKG